MGEPLFNTKDMDIERVPMSTAKQDELVFTIEATDRLRELNNKDFGKFYSLECTVEGTPVALNFSSEKLATALNNSLENIREVPLKLVGTGQGVERYYTLEIVG